MLNTIFSLNPNSVHNQAPNESNSASCLHYIYPHVPQFDITQVKCNVDVSALGKIGVVQREVKDCLLWAMRYEEKPGVRAEACHSIKQLEIMDEDVVNIIQERLLVESSHIVRE